MDQREREVEPALHPARVAAHAAVGGVGQADPLEQLVSPPRALGAWQALKRRLKAHVLATGEVWVERGLLERGADRGAHVGALADDVVAGTRAVPDVGGSSVVSISTVVDLPAPFGPRKP